MVVTQVATSGVAQDQLLAQLSVTVVADTARFSATTSTLTPRGKSGVLSNEGNEGNEGLNDMTGDTESIALVKHRVGTEPSAAWAGAACRA